MKVRTAIALLVVSIIPLSSGTTSWAQSLQAKKRSDQIREIIQFEMRWSGIPGMATAVIADGVLVHRQAYGLASIELNAPLSTATVFQLSSTSKAFTGVAAMMLVQDGLLDLDAPVGRYLKELPLSWRAVTVRQLLSHTSGLPEVLECETSSRVEALACVTELPPLAPGPGEVFRYNQTNYFLALMIIERLSEMPFQDYMLSRIFSPCGMLSTVYAGSNFEVVPGRATSYYPDEEGTLRQREFDFPEYLYSAAGLNSSLEDLIRFAVALTSGRLLGSDALAEMWRDSTLSDGEVSTYGLGWDIKVHGNGGRSAGHEGGRLTTIRHFIDEGITVIVLSNGFTSRFNPDKVAEQIAAVFSPDLADPTDDLLRRMKVRMLDGDLDGALATYFAFIGDPAGLETNTEAMINSLGYELLGSARSAEAVAILSLNVKRYPESANAHDSLGEAMAAAGDRATALSQYRESLRLDPSNHNAEEMIEKLSQ
jgi:CubicO group peptidase (beta-lactamase class C family)